MKHFLRQNGLLLLIIALLLSVLIGIVSAVMGGNADPLSNAVVVSPAPKAVLTRMPAPRHIPLMNRMARVIRGFEVPTAASASSPTNLPTMMLSAAL